MQSEATWAKRDMLTGWLISFGEGDEALRQGRFKDADRLFINAEKELDGDTSDAGELYKATPASKLRIILAISLTKFDMHDFENCESQLKRFIGLNPYGNAIPYEILGDLCQVQGRFEDAKDNYEKAVVARQNSRSNMNYTSRFHVGMRDRLQKKLLDLKSKPRILLPVPYTNASASEYLEDFQTDVRSADYLRSHPWAGMSTNELQK